jgi:HEAT repeat protein
MVASIPAAGASSLPESGSTIDALVAGLTSGNWMKRHDARVALEHIGGSVAEPVAELLRTGDDLARWEAARTLVAIGTPAVAPTLADALDDEEPGVRWFASEALRRLGPTGTIATLRELGRHISSGWMHEGAHRVLRRSHDPRVEPVLRALEGPFASQALPGPLFTALREISESPGG